MTDEQPRASTAGMLRDVMVYTFARLVVVGVLTVVILFAARVIGIKEFPVVVAMLFAIIISLPVGIWLLGPLRRRATAGIALVDERRRRDRAELHARLRGNAEEKPVSDDSDKSVNDDRE